MGGLYLSGRWGEVGAYFWRALHVYSEFLKELKITHGPKTIQFYNTFAYMYM